MRAVHFDDQAARGDDEGCFHCGLCTTECTSGAIQCNLGALRLKIDDGAIVVIPVVLRQSNKLRALKLAEDLKKKILGGSFKITQWVEHI